MDARDKPGHDEPGVTHRACDRIGGASGEGGLVQRQPHQIAVMLAGIAVRRLVEGIGELPFLRLVAPLRRGMADDVVGTAGVADRRGTSSPIDYLLLDRLRPVLRDKVLGDPVLGRFKRVDQPEASQHRSCIHPRVPRFAFFQTSESAWPFHRKIKEYPRFKCDRHQRDTKAAFR